MTGSHKKAQPSGSPTQWTGAALRWALENAEQEVAIGKEIETVEVPDREIAIAMAHHLLDKHAHEAIGETSLEIHVMPPEQLPSDKEPSGFRHYKVSAEARKQAQTLGIPGGDVEARVARMARQAAPFTHPMANRRFERFIMRVELKSLADSVLADITRMTVRQTLTAPLAGALQSAFAGGGFGLFHEGGVVEERLSGVRYADPGIFEQAQRYHGGGFAGAGLLPDEVPIIARRGELVVPPERIVREEKSAREQRPITVVVNVTAADASSFRASQGQIAADMARAIARASRYR